MLTKLLQLLPFIDCPSARSHYGKDQKQHFTLQVAVCTASSPIFSRKILYSTKKSLYCSTVESPTCCPTRGRWYQGIEDSFLDCNTTVFLSLVAQHVMSMIEGPATPWGWTHIRLRGNYRSPKVPVG